MTTRSRKEANLARRLKWAESRRAKESSIVEHNLALPYHDDIAFLTQPGRIIAREQMNKRNERAYAHSKVAAVHEERAANIEQQLSASIYDDDPDAVEQLQARIGIRESIRDRMKAFNSKVRKDKEVTADALRLLGPVELKDYEQIRRYAAFQLGKNGEFPGYALSNLGQQIRKDKERILIIERKNQLISERRDQTADVVIEYSGARNEWCKVTFREKPPYEVTRALGRHGAGFRWNGVNWQGETSKLPTIVKEMEK